LVGDAADLDSLVKAARVHQELLLGPQDAQLLRGPVELPLLGFDRPHGVVLAVFMFMSFAQLLLKLLFKLSLPLPHRLTELLVRPLIRRLPVAHGPLGFQLAPLLETDEKSPAGSLDRSKR
jgi:hypothetical protein